jgi:hypothetical protein
MKNKGKLNNEDFIQIKLILNEYATQLELKLCDITLAMNQVNDIKLEKQLENEFNKVEDKWSRAINLLRKLY